MVNQNNNPEERRKLRSSDVLMKIVVICLTFICGGLSWGLREIFYTLRTHEVSIVKLSVERENDHALVVEHQRQIILVSSLEERVSSNEGRLGNLQLGITQRLDRLENKLDSILETRRNKD